MNKMQYNSDSGLLVKNQQRRGLDKINPIESIDITFKNEFSVDFGFIAGANIKDLGFGGYVNMWSMTLLDYDNSRYGEDRLRTGMENRDIKGEISIGPIGVDGFYGNETNYEVAEGIMNLNFQTKDNKLKTISIEGNISYGFGIFFGITGKHTPSLNINLK